MIWLFVYGTLRKNGTNHWQLAQASLLATDVRLPGYELFDNGLYPYAVASDRPGVGILGEIYGIDAPTLAQLDVLEGLATGHYCRVVDPTSQAYIYLKADRRGLAQCPKIPSGDWQPAIRTKVVYSPENKS
jgi:gamma-glutamylcyclotransferase (GGCT)/AIG2-like uncharacterized protein YtfP